MSAIPQVEIRSACPKCAGINLENLGKRGNLIRRKCLGVKCGHRFWVILYYADQIAKLEIKPKA